MYQQPSGRSCLEEINSLLIDGTVTVEIQLLEHSVGHVHEVI